MSCVNYFLVFKPLVMDGLEGEMYGNELKMYYIYKDNLPSKKKDCTEAVTTWFFRRFPFEEWALC